MSNLFVQVCVKTLCLLIVLTFLLMVRINSGCTDIYVCSCVQVGDIANKYKSISIYLHFFEFLPLLSD